MKIKSYNNAKDILNTIDELKNYKYLISNPHCKPEIAYGNKLVKTLMFDSNTYEKFRKVNLKFIEKRIKELEEEFD